MDDVARELPILALPQKHVAASPEGGGDRAWTLARSGEPSPVRAPRCNVQQGAHRRPITRPAGLVTTLLSFVAPFCAPRLDAPGALGLPPPAFPEFPGALGAEGTTGA